MSTPLSPLVRQRESPIYPHVPCERRPHPNKKYAGGAGWGRSEHWKRTPKKTARSAMVDPSELSCERRPHPAEPLSANPLR
jgi:hypothetical protein